MTTPSSHFTGSGASATSNKVSDILARVTISQVWSALGGGPLRHARGHAFWRNGGGWNVALDDTKGAWFDHAAGEGGGILDLVRLVLGLDRKAALHWVADLAGVSLDDKTSSPAQRRDWARRRRAAEIEARPFVEWRRNLIAYLVYLRNRWWGIDRRACRWAQAHLNDPAVPDGSWTLVFAMCETAIRLAGAADTVLRRVRSAPFADLLPAFRLRRSERGVT